MTLFSTLRARIFVALGAVILLVVSMSILVAIWTADQEFAEFVDEYGLAQATDLAGMVEIEYNRTGSLNAAAQVLDTQFFYQSEYETFDLPYNTEVWEQILEQSPSDQVAIQQIMQYELERDSDSAEFDHLLDRWYWVQSYVYDAHAFDDDNIVSFADASYIYLADAQGNVQYSNDAHAFDQIPSDLQPYSVPVFDWTDGNIVGYVYVESSADFADESSGFIQGTIYTSAFGGLLTALFALAIGAWLARRISNPVRALTEAATRLAEDGSTEQLPVNSSDELGQMSAAFNRMTQSLAAQQQIRKRLVADVSHELNTPLAIMRLEAQGMADGMQTPEEAAVTIQREIDLLHNLVNDLELIVETDQNAVTLQKEAVHVNQFLAEVLHRWQPKAEGLAIDLRLSPPDFSSTIQLDPNRVRQVLGNLLRNALQHTPAGGQVVISAETTSDNLQIAIRDSGCGIAPDHLPFVFDRFYRTDEARQRVSGGRGLGLAIVKQLVELHGGRVWATSKLGVGSTFFVALPMI